MTTRKLKNDRNNLLHEVLYPCQKTLAHEKTLETNQHRLLKIYAELEQIDAKIAGILDKQIKDLTADMLNDPNVQKDMKEIRKATKEARDASKEVKNAANKVKAVKRTMKKTSRAIKKLATFFA